MTQTNSEPRITRFWITGTVAVVEWITCGLLDIARYALGDRQDHLGRWVPDILWRDGADLPSELEDDVYDIVTRCERPELTPLRAGPLSDAPAISEAA